MANAWTNVDMIAAESCSILKDAMILGNLAAKDKSGEFNSKPNGYSVGDTVRINTRPDFEAREFNGSQIQIQEIRSSARSMTIEKLFDVSVKLTAKEKALNLDSFTEQVIIPATYRLAEKCELYLGSKLSLAQGLYASTEIFADQADMALARGAANLSQLSPTGRYCLINDTLENRLLGKGYFAQYGTRGTDGMQTFANANLGYALGMNFFQSYAIPSWTLAATGTGTSTTDNGVAVDGVYPNNKLGSTTLTIDALTNTFPAGTRIRIAGVRRPLVVASLASAGATSVSLAHPISEIIPDGAAVTVVSSNQTNLSMMGIILDDESLAMAMPVLDTPSDKLAYTVSMNGYTIRVVVGYDMNTKCDVMSLDCLIGAQFYDLRRGTILAEY